MTNLNSNVEEIQALRSGKQPRGRIVQGLNHEYISKPLGEQSTAVKRQAMWVIFGNLGVVSTGIGMGLPTITQRPMTDSINETVYLTQSQFTWFASLNLLAAPIGGLLSGLLLDKLGRKYTMWVLNVFALIAWALIASASKENKGLMLVQLMISRFLIGINTGLASAPVGVYSAEISTPKMRGRFILGTSISMASGITIIYILGFFIRDDWRLIGWICFAYQIFSFTMIIAMPESPNWLITKNRLREARKSLNYFRGLDKKEVITHPEVLAEFNTLQKNIQVSVKGQTKPSFLRSLRLSEVYKPLLILMGLFTFQQVTGIFVIIVYAVQISMEAGVTIDPFLCAVFVGLARLITTIPLVYILEKWGRRRCGMISAGGMGICMFLLTLQNQPGLNAVPYLPVIAIISFILLSTIGLYTLPFFMLSELFPQSVRGPASGLTVAFGTLISFVCTKTYPAMRDAIGNQYCFLIYGIAAFIGLAYVYWILPETRGRTLFEIEEQFRNPKKSKSQPLEVELKEIYVP